MNLTLPNPQAALRHTTQLALQMATNQMNTQPEHPITSRAGMLTVGLCTRKEGGVTGHFEGGTQRKG